MGVFCDRLFWKDDCCPDVLFLDLRTSDHHHRPNFDQAFQFWTHIGPTGYLRAKFKK